MRKFLREKKTLKLRKMEKTISLLTGCLRKTPQQSVIKKTSEETVMQKCNKNIQIIRKRYKRGVNKLHVSISKWKKSKKTDEFDEAELTKANCKCRIDRIVAQAKVQMGMESEIIIKNRDCLNCNVTDKNTINDNPVIYKKVRPIECYVDPHSRRTIYLLV